MDFKSFASECAQKLLPFSIKRFDRKTIRGLIIRIFSPLWQSSSVNQIGSCDIYLCLIGRCDWFVFSFWTLYRKSRKPISVKSWDHVVNLSPLNILMVRSFECFRLINARLLTTIFVSCLVTLSKLYNVNLSFESVHCISLYMYLLVISVAEQRGLAAHSSMKQRIRKALKAIPGKLKIKKGV